MSLEPISSYLQEEPTCHAFMDGKDEFSNTGLCYGCGKIYNVTGEEISIMKPHSHSSIAGDDTIIYDQTSSEYGEATINAAILKLKTTITEGMLRATDKNKTKKDRELQFYANEVGSLW